MPFLSRSKIFLILCICFIVGVLVSPILTKPIMVIMAMFFVGLISIWFNNRIAVLAGIAGLILLTGGLRFQISLEQNNLKNYYGRNVQMQAIVSEEPDARDDKIYLTVSHIIIDDKVIEDKMLVSVYTSRNYNYGDKFEFIGKISEPAVFDDFNYKNYLSRFGIHAVMYYPKADLVASKQGNLVKAALLGTKQSFLNNLEKVLPEPQNAFLAGLLVGNKRSIPQNYIDAFNATGTSHIIAISGYNITIIAWALDLLLRRFGKKASLIGSSLAILAFVILTGGSASVIRAAVMGALGLIALNIGRLFNITNALAATAAVMVLINPQILIYDVGFQLSFLALAGLVYFSPVIIPYFDFLPEIISKPLVATLAAQIFALPVLLFNFDQLSLVAPLTNVLVLELVPFTMLFGFMTGLIGFVWLNLSAVFAWPAWILLSYILKVVELTARIPFSNISVHLNLPAVASYYVALIAILVYYKYRHESFTNEKFSSNLVRI